MNYSTKYALISYFLVKLKRNRRKFMELKDSKTYQNLRVAFYREAGATLEYQFYRDQAQTQGYQQIYNTFNLFAKNEQAHAKIWFKLFHGIADTEENLKDAMELEIHERKQMYEKFIQTAEEEGFTDIAQKLRGVAKIEEAHEKEYKALHLQLKNDQAFTQDKKCTWQCLNCGHIHKGTSAPLTCPVCSMPMGYFALKEKNN